MSKLIHGRADSVIDVVTEGIVHRDQRKEVAAFIDKWESMGLLEGLEGFDRTNMALLLENQAKEILREATLMQSGDVEGFASVAFPIVRRVFGDTIANNIVSVQPMNQASGLIFFLDFQYTDERLGNPRGASVYGGGRVGAEITGGVLIDTVGDVQYGERGPYALNNGYSSATASLAGNLSIASVRGPFMVGNSEENDAFIRFDPDMASGTYAEVVTVTLSAAQMATVNTRNLVAIKADLPQTTASGTVLVRRLTTIPTGSDLQLQLVYAGTSSFTSLAAADQTVTLEFPENDNFQPGGALGSVIGAANWGLENETAIPEIDLKVDSISIVAKTRKLKATWSPEVGQDLNSYHNLDAEAELTGMLAEHVQMEIDREILEDLVKGAKAGTFYWSRLVGKFVSRTTGEDTSNATSPPDFTGNISEWYEGLLECVNDISAQIHRRAKRGGANFFVTSPEVASILETTSGWRAQVSVDVDMGSAGAVKVGKVSHKWDVFVDPHFPRNLLLVGRRGSKFLESGYVYAPYVPLIMTQTILDPESFVPRKGVMTRYAKKMVRPDLYGLVVVQDLLLPGT